MMINLYCHFHVFFLIKITNFWIHNFTVFEQITNRALYVCLTFVLTSCFSPLNKLSLVNKTNQQCQYYMYVLFNKQLYNNILFPPYLICMGWINGEGVDFLAYRVEIFIYTHIYFTCSDSVVILTLKGPKSNYFNYVKFQKEKIQNT